MAFKMDNSPFPRKKIRYDEDKGEYVKHRGKKVYGNWNEFEPNRKNKVKTKGLNKHLVEKDGDLHVNESTWDSTLSHNKKNSKVIAQGADKEDRRSDRKAKRINRRTKRKAG